MKVRIKLLFSKKEGCILNIILKLNPIMIDRLAEIRQVTTTTNHSSQDKTTKWTQTVASMIYNHITKLKDRKESMISSLRILKVSERWSSPSTKTTTKFKISKRSTPRPSKPHSKNPIANKWTKSSHKIRTCIKASSKRSQNSRIELTKPRRTSPMNHKRKWRGISISV